MIKKEQLRKYLETIPVIIEDTSELSENYFKIVSYPKTLQAGKNLFRLQGSNNLDIGKQVQIEVLDYNKNTIYHEITDILEVDGSRIVSIWVYPDTAAGPGRITIVGVANRDLLGNLIPESRKQSPNVRWSVAVNVAPEARNNSEILYNVDPTVTMTEVSRSLFTKQYSGSRFASLTASPISAQYRYVNQTAIITSTTDVFTDDMNSGTITIATGNFSNLFPPAIQPVSNSSYVATIDKVLNSRQIRLTVPYTLYSTGLPANHIYESAQISGINSIYYEQKPILSPVTQSFVSASVVINQTLSGSFGLMTLNNLAPETGDTYRIRVYFRKASAPGIAKSFKGYDTPSNYVPVSNTVVKSQEILIDGNANEIDQPIGIFSGSASITQYWTVTASAALNGATISSSFSNYPLIRSLYIASSSGTPSTFSDNQYFIVQTKNSYEFSQDTIYNLTFDTITEAGIGFNEGTNYQLLDIVLSGSACTDTYLNLSNVKYIGSIQNTSGYFYENNSFDFTVNRSGTAQLMFLLRSGKWHFSDVSLRARQYLGFTPNKINLLIPIEEYLTENFDIKIEYYDFENNQSKTITEIKDFRFTRPTILRYVSGYGRYSYLDINQIGSVIQANTFSNNNAVVIDTINANTINEITNLNNNVSTPIDVLNTLGNTGINIGGG